MKNGPLMTQTSAQMKSDQNKICLIRLYLRRSLRHQRAILLLTTRTSPLRNASATTPVL